MTIYMQTAARPVKEAPITEAERKARGELAAAYRIFDMLGGSLLIFNHLTLRVEGPASSPESSRFLINPLGLHSSEITASSLLLVDLVAGHARIARQIDQALDLRNRHVQRAAMAHEVEPLEVLGAVGPITRRGARRSRQQPFALVVAHGLHVDAGLVSEFSDPHGDLTL